MDILDIVNRIKTLKGLDKDSQVAELIGLSSANFSNRKRQGSLLEPITKWAVTEDIDLNWLFKGNPNVAVDNPMSLYNSLSKELSGYKSTSDFRFSRIETKLDKLIETFLIPDSFKSSKKSSGEW